MWHDAAPRHATPRQTIPHHATPHHTTPHCPNPPHNTPPHQHTSPPHSSPSYSTPQTLDTAGGEGSQRLVCSSPPFVEERCGSVPVYITNNRDNPSGTAQSYDYVGFSYYETHVGQACSQQASRPPPSNAMTDRQTDSERTHPRTRLHRLPHPDRRRTVASPHPTAPRCCSEGTHLRFAGPCHPKNGCVGAKAAASEPAVRRHLKEQSGPPEGVDQTKNMKYSRGDHGTLTRNIQHSHLRTSGVE